MNKIKLGIIALSASVTIFAPAESVAATTQSASSPTTAAAVCTLLCFDLYEDGIRVGHDVDVMTAIKFCYGIGPPQIPIETLALGERIECYPYQGHRRWVIRSR
jgi:hypothetical protein